MKSLLTTLLMSIFSFALWGQDSTFAEIQKLIASDVQVDDKFGWSVSISKDYAIIGAGVQDGVAPYTGAAYIFEREESGNWIEVNKLVDSDGQAWDLFGCSVSVSGNYAIVGACHEDEGGDDAGAAYIFEREDNGNWIEVNKLLSSDAHSVGFFGHSVSISGNYAIVGSPGEGAVGYQAGAAYIYKREENGNWAKVNKLIASDAQSEDWFGHSVSISDNYAIVGARYEDEGGSKAGAAYIYKREENGNWSEVNKLLASDTQASDEFGWSVSISGNYAIIGAPDEDEGGDDAGAAYIYKREENGNWTEVNKLLASDAQAGDYFGYSVSISGDYAIVGAGWEDEGGNSAGAAYIFEKSDETTAVEVELQPENYSLDQNYPNPFNPSTEIKFALPVTSNVSVKVYNVVGQLVANLAEGNYAAGTHTLNFNASALSSGVYFYTVEAKGTNGINFRETKKMMLLK